MKSSIADKLKSKVEDKSGSGGSPAGNKAGPADNKAGPSDKPSTGSTKSVEDIIKEAKAKSDVEKGAKAGADEKKVGGASSEAHMKMKNENANLIHTLSDRMLMVSGNAHYVQT